VSAVAIWCGVLWAGLHTFTPWDASYAIPSG
ncbi:unnamed protein product, partial [marine sediment metagenome]